METTHQRETEEPAFYTEAISLLKQHTKKTLPKDKLARLKIELCTKHQMKKIPTDIQIMLNASAEDLEQIKPILLTKPTRSLSGVAPIAVMTKPLACKHGKCTFCPGGPGSSFGDVPMSYTGNEPSTMRAMRANYDPYFIVFNRLEQYILLNQIPDKAEVIVQGGTFPSFEKNYQEEVIKYILKAMNDFSKMFFKNNKFNFEKFKKFFELPGSIKDLDRTLRIHEKLKKIKGSCDLNKEKLKNENAQI